MNQSELENSNRHSYTKDPVEGEVAKAIEKQTARIPSDAFLMAAGGSIAVAFALRAAGRKDLSLFVGQWVAPILLLGVYNKIVKVAGSDKRS